MTSENERRRLNSYEKKDLSWLSIDVGRVNERTLMGERENVFRGKPTPFPSG